MFRLSEEIYLNKVYGGWLGKSIGGTLGTPVEGEMELLKLDYYIKLPNGPAANDDLDLQLVWLHALEQHGPALTSFQLGQAWQDHIFFPFDEYGYALSNLRRGLVPPVSGSFNNPFINCMGSPIRSEIWAMVAPGVPEVAAYYAYQDAVVDHAGGEGVWGEIFLAAIESAAFVSSDKNELLSIGLSFIPATSRVARVVKDTIEWFQQGYSWIETRELILKHYGHPNFTDAPQNIGFVVLGWLYGDDWGDALLKTVNCGYDTDSSGAALGAILGIVAGNDNIPNNWAEPIGVQVSVSREVNGFRAPGDLKDLTQRTLAVARQILAAWDAPLTITSHFEQAVEFEPKPNLSSFSASLETTFSADPKTNLYLLPAGAFRQPSLEVTIGYGQEGPAIGINQVKFIYISLKNRSSRQWQGTIELEIPASWQVSSPRNFSLGNGEITQWSFEVKSGPELKAFYQLKLNIHRTHNGSPWDTSQIAFSLVAATQWRVWEPGAEVNEEGKIVIFPGNKLEMSTEVNSQKPGVYRAETKLITLREQTIRLVAATTSPIKVRLNGTEIINDASTALFMPAFHRPSKKRYKDISLSAGSHNLELEVILAEQPLELFVIAVAAGETEEAGKNYFLTDVFFNA